MKTEIFKNTTRLQQADGLSRACIDPRARASFYYAFDVTPPMQEELERQYDLMTITPLVTEAVPRTAVLDIPRDNIAILAL
jgi:hypothetical protein